MVKDRFRFDEVIATNRTKGNPKVRLVVLIGVAIS